MEEIRAIVLRAAGTNCDMETAYALELAGAQADRVHINQAIGDKGLLEQYHILVFPGGFSYGDDVAAGKILANQVIHHLAQATRKFIDDGKLVLGICNGFQVLVKAGILPGVGRLGAERPCASGPHDQDRRAGTPNAINRVWEPTLALQEDVTITCNDSGKYEDRWVYLAPQTSRCVFIEPERQIYLPVAHGEGKVIARNEQALQKLRAEGYIAYKYVDENGEEGPFPINPNGSVDSIAGLTDGTGRVLGLMPHPERFIRRTQHPHWSRLGEDLDPDGIKVFRNAVRYVRDNLLQSCTV